MGEIIKDSELNVTEIYRKMSGEALQVLLDDALEKLNQAEKTVMDISREQDRRSDQQRSWD